MSYKMLTTQEDIKDFMNNFNYFHDSCIKEIKYISGGFVGEEKAMFPLNSKRIVSIIFQSQNAKYSVIEMQFSFITKLNLEPKFIRTNIVNESKRIA